MNEDGHYQAFHDLYEISTTEKDLPSSLEKQKKVIGFNVTQQHIKNVDRVIQCDECHMWRLLISKKRLSPQSRFELSKIMEDVSYTCGALLDDLNMPEDLKSVCIRAHKCHDLVETLYYSCYPEDPICIYCSQAAANESGEVYPQCADCSSKVPIKRIKRGRK